MKLTNFAYLTDENIHTPVLDWLRKLGLNVTDVKELGLAGQDDVTLLNVATFEQRVVITHDGDFGRLAVAGEQLFYGIIYIQPGHIVPQETVKTLGSLFGETINLEPPFIVIARRKDDKVKLRVRQY